MVPKMMFLTKGVGVDKNRLSSFELALRNAGIEQFNLVHVSSILPPLCKIVPRSEGLRHLEAGEIVYCVMARNETDEPNRLISASIGLAMTEEPEAVRVSFGAPRLRPNGGAFGRLCRGPRGDDAGFRPGHTLY